MARCPSSLRIAACLLIAGMGLSRGAHAPHHAAHSHTTHGHNHPADSPLKPSDQPPDPPAHDSDQCQICHVIANASLAVDASRPALASAAPAADLRLCPVVCEPHSADVELPCAARAPPFIASVA